MASLTLAAVATASAPIMASMPASDAKLKSRPYSAPRRKEACTCGSLRKASRRITQFYDTALSPVGIKSTQFSILTEVDRGSLDGPVSMCELAAAMVMDRSTLGHNLRPLERDELLILRLAVADRRKRHVELTKKGRSTLRAARRLWRTAEGRFEKIFGKQHAAELRSVLLSIAGNDELNSLPLR